MGNLLSGTSFKEPTTVEDCDSTWQTDSEPEADEEEDGRDGSGPGSCEGPGHEPEQPAGPPARASPRSEESRAAPEGDADAAGNKEQNDNSTESAAKPKRSFYAARDLYKYRHQYPNFKDLRYQNDLSNLRFYKNKIPFKPDGVYIEEVLNKWKGDYEKLEHNHTYIQWLFPLREQGLNFYAKELTTYEIEEFKKTKEATRRFFLAYKMMLEFFGMKLTDKIGNVTRATNWQERFQHLNESQHNYLRITRILKSLGELGYEHFKSPLVKFILQEALVENTLPNIKQSALEYFVYTIRDRRERRKLLRFAQQHYTPPDHFIWGPAKKQKPEGSKAAKTPTSPVSGHNIQSMHKKSKESKNNSTAVHLSSKAAEENKGELKENGENADWPGMEAGNEVAKPRNSEKDGSAESPNSKPEKTINNLLDKKENAPSFEKGEDSECQSLDCENSGVKRKGSSDEDSKNCSSNCSENTQTSLGKEKTIVEPIPKNKDEVRS